MGNSPQSQRVSIIAAAPFRLSPALSKELFTRQVGLHMQGDDGQRARQGVSFWGTAYYAPGTGAHQAYRFGSNQDIGAGAVGMDFTLGDFILGVDGGWSDDQLKYQLGYSRGHANSSQIGGYASYQSGPFDVDLKKNLPNHASEDCLRLYNVDADAVSDDASR